LNRSLAFGMTMPKVVSDLPPPARMPLSRRVRTCNLISSVIPKEIRVSKYLKYRGTTNSFSN
jgi:hypothetical protein